ncbi:efflux RND transporter permease subunit [Limibacillus sp. MBR-115]|jgi:HAE1 family hydrophobic/amphiphilic exporter-1|uniref:efflux RND transporter permease subunit n=1 Tax=Limibacillus sp. MBR-115 TaxID=3156465 RepID=UPI0033997A95
MNLIRGAIERPIAVIAVVLMVVLFGMVALQAIPIQLAPDVRQPTITIETTWAGAAPAEIEREIVVEQEDVLKGLEGLEEITSRAETGRARVTLEFAVGTNMDRALLLTANRLDRVPGYPNEADEPTLDTSGSEDNPIAWFVVTRLPGVEQPIHTFGDFVEDVIAERIERVPGVAKVNYFGGSEREIQVVVEPERMARYGLTVTRIIEALRRANTNTSAGDVEEGKRRYVVRTEGELDSLEAVRSVVVRSFEDTATGRLARVTIGDIAKVAFSYKEPTATIRQLGQSTIAFNAVRDTGANVIETMRGIREALDDLNAFVVPNAGLQVNQVYDETVYINSAIDLVEQNIYIGGSLAAILLLLFLRSFRATLVISLAIPVSVIGAFVAMAALGRSINVISLAGLAFSVGMVVDAAIVVLENIYRLRERGYSAREAAFIGANQVWGAVLVSALTTVMVFIPILIMELEVGQLFRDIAVAISVSVLLSLLVSVTVIPALSSKLFGLTSDRDKERSLTKIRLPIIDDLAQVFVRFVLGFLSVVVRRKIVAFLVVGTVTCVAAFSAWVFLPKLEYLPEGNRNLVFGVIVPPPGYNLPTMAEIAGKIEQEIKPLWVTESGPERELGGPPKIERFFFVATRGNTFLGAISAESQKAAELIPVLQQHAFVEPGTFGFISQPSIFGRGIGSGRKIDLDIRGPDLEEIVGVAQEAFGRAQAVLPREVGNQYRPNPGLELGAPELRVLPDRIRLADNGVTAQELADTIDAFNDGLRVVEVTVGTQQLDLTLRGPESEITETQGIANLPVVTQIGQIIPAGSLAKVELTSGPTEIRHRDRLRTITLEIRPIAQLPLEQAVEILQEKVIGPMIAEGLPPGMSMTISGTADKLSETWDAMVLDLLLAIVIVYLVMAVLFESFIYPLIILLAVPLAAAGGIGGLAALNTYVYQPMDMLTLLGFVILIGIVVNNAILIVHQTLFHVREEGMEATAAILEATRNRIRPIFMSTLTSVFGMLPLVLFPGAGSELYRGLGSVVLGGLSLSALLTLLIIPPMLTFLVGPLENRKLKKSDAQKVQGQTGEAVLQPAGE